MSCFVETDHLLFDILLFVDNIRLTVPLTGMNTVKSIELPLSIMSGTVHSPAHCCFAEMEGGLSHKKCTFLKNKMTATVRLTKFILDKSSILLSF